MPEPEYRLIVGNIGTTYRGKNEDKARRDFAEYVQISKLCIGHRAYMEEVALFCDDEIAEEYIPDTGEPPEEE